jgi:hypothetical protein
MLNDVTFIQYEGGLARTLTGEDYVSGLVAATASQPSGFASDNTQVFFTLLEAEAAGITAAAFPAVHYHIAQYFAANPQGELQVLLASTVTPADIATLQLAAEGRIRQVAFIDIGDFATATVSALQTVADGLKADHMGLSILLAADFTDFTLSTLPSLTTLSAPNVSVVIGMDAASPYSGIGATLGIVSLSSVSECIAWLKKFNVVKGTDFQTLAFATGEQYKSVSPAQLSAVKTKGYIFLRKYMGYDGSFHSDSNTATAQTSDFATIENVRTIEKAERSIRAALLPELGAPLKTKGGKLALETLTKFELLVKNRLEQMANADEVSEFSIFIDPNQNVLSTSELRIQVGITPLGVARQIVVGIGFEVKAN